MTTGNGLQKVSGQITAINHANRTVALMFYEEKNGNKYFTTATLRWPAGLDAKMSKLKEKFFTSFTYLGEMIDDTQYFQKPEDWPKSQNKGNWGGGKPRNEKIIVLQSTLKACVDLFQVCTSPGTQDFDTSCDLVMEKAIAMTEKIMKEGGA